MSPDRQIIKLYKLQHLATTMEREDGVIQLAGTVAVEIFTAQKGHIYLISFVLKYLQCTIVVQVPQQPMVIPSL